MSRCVSVVLLGCLLLGCQPRPSSNRDPGEQPPNVVFILADDLGYHDLGFTGSTYYETPNLDRLAASSVVFDQAYAGSRVCSPSRASIMLGQFTATHGITDWIGAPAEEEWRRYNRFTSHLPPQYNRVLPDSALTLAEAFQQNGYRTFFAGKWHLGGAGSMPTDHGFDVNVGGNDKGSPVGGYFDPYDNRDLPNRLPGENLSRRLARETKEFIFGEPGPFFAFLSFYAVHGPIQTTEEDWRYFRNKAVEGGNAQSAFSMERRLPIRTEQDNPVYAGLVRQMDDAVGIVLDALDSLGIADNTIVVFTSDNGGVASGDAYATSNLPLRGGKGYQWEGGIREPLFLRVGDRIPHQTISEAVIGADLYPTLVSLSGLDVEPPQIIDGKNLMPLLRDDDWPERALIWHYPHYGNQGGDPSSVIRRGDWKLIHYWEDGHDELYRLGGGAQEKADLANDQPDRVEELRTELLTFLEDRGAAYPRPDPEFDLALFRQKEIFYRDTLLPRLENQRREMFREDWSPNADWWGSRPE
ncbi:sulfatase [Lewinella sp. IMCC34191]|uniref:sulfatase n=1 Tax=Lewinella sp. IMCC34191 TaxID=2259172 RepID=UPI000E23062C|nr:sulfatase [Lewinella sp. IMCC34191]